MPKARTFFRVTALLFMVLTLILVVPALYRYATQSEAPGIDTAEAGATILFASDVQIVLLDSSCLDVRWHVEGIRTVHVNGKPVTGEGLETVCGESPRLTVELQNGSVREYKLPRQVALTSTLRALIVGSVLVLLATFVPWRAPRFVRLPLSELRQWFTTETGSNRLALYIITGLGFALRLAYLNGPVKQDEVTSFLDYASKSTWDAVSLYYSTNNHIFNTLLMNLSVGLFGNQPWVLRLPVFIAGVLVIPATYVAGRLLYNSRAGLLAAAFVAASSVLSVFATYARGYMLQALFAVVMLAAAVYVLRRRAAFGWLIYAVCISLGFYTSASMVYPFAAISACVALNLLQRVLELKSLRPLVPWMVATVTGLSGAAILHLPVFIVSGLDAFLANEYVIPQSLTEFASTLPGDLQSAWNGWTYDFPWALSLVVGAGFLTAILRNRQISTFAFPLGLIALVVIPPIMFLLRVPIYERVLIPLVPLFFIIASGGAVYVMRLGERWTAPLTTGLALLLGLIILSTNAVHHAKHWDMGAFPEGYEVMAALLPHLEPRDVVIVHRRGGVMRYYANLYDLGLEYVTVPREPRAARRVFVVAPYPSQPPDKVLSEFGFDPASFDAPELLQHFEDYALYLVTQPSSAVQST